MEANPNDEYVCRSYPAAVNIETLEAEKPKRVPRRDLTEQEIADIDGALSIIRAEMIFAISKFNPYNSLHEAYGVIKEEFDEFWEDVKANDEEAAVCEATQVAATAARAIIDLGGLA